MSLRPFASQALSHGALIALLIVVPAVEGCAGKKSTQPDVTVAVSSAGITPVVKTLLPPAGAGNGADISNNAPAPDTAPDLGTAHTDAPTAQPDGSAGVSTTR